MTDTRQSDQSLTVSFRGQDTTARVTTYGNAAHQILCLHGIGSTGIESYANLARYLSHDFQLVAPDWIGFGGSSRLLGPQDSYSADYCSEWLGHFIHTAVRQGTLRPPFTILAHSMSAIAVAKAFSKIKEHIRTIVLINPAGMDTEINRAFSFFLTSRLVPQYALARLILMPWIWYRVLRWSENHYRRMVQGLADGEFDVLLRYARAGIRPIGKMKPSHIIPDVFSTITAPVLLLTSSRDSIFSHQRYLDYAEKYVWQIHRIHHQNHYLLTRAAAEIAKTIRVHFSAPS